MTMPTDPHAKRESKVLFARISPRLHFAIMSDAGRRRISANSLVVAILEGYFKGKDTKHDAHAGSQ